jgi:hypothetical protein
VTNNACFNKICLSCSAEFAVPREKWLLEKDFEFASLLLLMVFNFEISLYAVTPVNIQHVGCLSSSVRLHVFDIRKYWKDFYSTRYWGSLLISFDEV